MTYPNGRRYDCEAIFIDQGKGARRAGTQGRVYLITKGDNRNDDPQWRRKTQDLDLRCTERRFSPNLEAQKQW